MLSFISKWFHSRKRKQTAVKAAISHFEATIGTRAHSGKVIGEKGGNFIVRVFYDHGKVKPLRRKWYLLGQHDSVIAELSFDEVRQFGERRLK